MKFECFFYRKFDEMTRNNTMQYLYRSKTPTVSSTEPKTILPIRPKTPLVDTRSRITTPSNELDFKHFKSGHSFLDTMENNNASSSSYNVMEKMTNNFEQLDIDSNIYENKSDSLKAAKNYLVNAPGSNGLDMNSESIYSMTTTYNNYGNNRNNYVENEYPHENCFCYECQDYAGRKQDGYLYSNYSTIPPQMDENLGKRLNQFINERRFQNIQGNASNQWEWQQKYPSNQVRNTGQPSSTF